MEADRQKRLFWLAGIVLLAGVLYLVWFFSFGAGSKASIEIYVVPSDSKVTMDGKPIKAGKVSIKKGKHTFEASRQYFGSVKQEADTAKLSATKIVYLALYPNSPEGEAYLKAHPEEQTRYERIAGAEFSALQEKILKEYPIATQLPYQTLDYKIDYDVTRDKKVVFLVKFYLPSAVVPGTNLYKQHLLRLKQEVLDYLSRQGVDTKKTTIQYDPDPSAQ